MDVNQKPKVCGPKFAPEDVTLQSLGMVRIKGPMTAECCLDLIKKRLEDFGLSLQEHIVGMVTDGASVMIKTGRLSGIIHQVCHSHGLHLAVCDVLYKKYRTIENTMKQTFMRMTMLFSRALMMKMMTNLGKLPCQMITMHILLIQ